MKELFEKLMAAGKAEALESVDGLKEAAKELGYTEEQIEAALSEVGGFPLGDADLERVAGGYPKPRQIDYTVVPYRKADK